MASSLQKRNESPTINELVGPQLSGLAGKAKIAAGIGLILTVLGLVFSRETFFQSYLFAFMFWFGITLGSTAWLMGHHVTGGGWGFLLRRQLEGATRLWPLILAMWVPILVAVFLSARDGHAGLYGWADMNVVMADYVLNKKVGYNNITGFILRATACFAIWFGLAYLLNKYSRLEDTDSSPWIRHKLSMWSGLGLVLYVLTVTFATIDWVMTLEPHWFSSLWGVIFIVGQGHSTLCILMILTKIVAGKTGILKNVETRYFRDVGNLMLAFTLLWAYTNYSQFMIQYSANLYEEAEWFVHRTTYGWQYFGGVNIILHFVAPFFLLLMSINKVNINNFVKLAAFLVIARHIDLYYYVVPTFRETPTSFPAAFLADFGLPLLLGGLWVWAWAVQMKKANAPLVPVYDERLNAYWPLPEKGAAHGTAHGGAAHGGQSAKEVSAHG